MDVTQWLGSVGFAVAGVLCLACRQTGWVLTGMVNLYFALDCLLDLRHRFRSVAIDAMGSLYALRGPYQIAMLIGALVMGLVIVALLQKRTVGRLERMAFTATALSAGLFLLEIISVHEVDRALYAHFGPALVVGWLWLGLAVLTSIAATLRLMARPEPDRSALG